ncbi:MAG: CvpA family protein [Rhodocyclaceae bacterium]|nr:CvpA family protein [Rhodocyclaceae bacterium]
MALTLFDYAVMGIVGLSLMLGLWRGVIGEILALAAWVLAFFAAREWGARAGELTLSGLIDPAWLPLAGFFEVFFAVVLVVAVARQLLRLLIKAAGMSVLDRVLGAFFGVARGMLIAWLLVLLAGLTPLPQQPWWRQAQFAPPLETAALAAKPWLPEALAQRIRYR